jgi:deoxyadenosine/deoxycytidine kinase
MNYAFIAIEGPIGVGKSAFIDALEREYGKQELHSFREELEPNPFLEKFYDNPKKYALQTQITFLLSRYSQYEALQKSLKQPELFVNRKIYVSDFILEKNDIFGELTIEDEQEWKLYQKIRDVLFETSKRFVKPSFVIYLRAGADVLYRRVQNAQKQTYKSITKEYLHKLTELYDRYFFHYKTSPVLIIDVNNISSITAIISSVKKSIDNPPTQNTYIKVGT